MNFRSTFSPAFLLGMAILLLALDPRQAKAFEVRPMAFSNTTKNRLMMPLTIDNKLFSSRLSGSETDSMSTAAPRGIVLNAAVGGLTFAGGLMGFVTKGSKASLIAGSTFGGLLMLSALLISKASKTKSTKGNILGFSISGLLGYVMGKKFLVSKKFMPAGLLTALSAIAVVYNLVETKIVSSSSKKEETEEIPSSADDTDESGTSSTSTTEEE